MQDLSALLQSLLCRYYQGTGRAKAVRTLLTIVASAVALSGCTSESTEKGPQAAASADHHQAIENYQSCVAANLSNPKACEALRHIMDADAQVPSAANASQQSNVYVGR